MIASYLRPRLAPALALVAGLALAFPAGAADAPLILDGRYAGTGAAEGAAISIAPDPGGFRGRFSDAVGNTQDFLADRTGDIADAVIDMGGGATLMQMVPRPYGAEVVLIPVDGEGRLLTDRGRVLDFLAPGLRAARYPEGFAFPPGAGEAAALTANAFLVSYPWWRPDAVARGYLAVPERFRTLMRLFPAVQLDVIWKLCLAPDADRAVGAALRGAGVSCGEARAGLAAAQAGGRYPDYRAEVAAAAEVLRRAVRCAGTYVMPREVCARSAREVAEAASAMTTPASVLARYR